ncbi:MAG: nucleotide pyrophosphohydrolase [Candidatus Omnitrophica bacterium]|nr:nucleotide pyrophosphohydrolase [Candidatus Omnitrophota bacterium]
MREHLEKILAFQKERDWKQYHTPKNLAISLSLEAGEILELFQWTDDHGLPDGQKEKLAHELADVYAYLLLLAHETDIDLHSAFEAKIKINNEKYPVEKSKGNSKKYTELN